MAFVASLAACAPAAGPARPSGDFPLDRSKLWGLSLGTASTTYVLSFPSTAVNRSTSLVSVEARASQGNGAFTVSMSYSPSAELLVVTLFLNRAYNVDDTALNCALGLNEGTISSLDPDDWVGLGSVEPPRAFLEKLGRSQLSSFQPCALFKGGSGLALAPRELERLRADLGAAARRLPASALERAAN